MSGISDSSYVSHSYNQPNITQSNRQSKLLVSNASHSISVLATDHTEKLKGISDVLNKNIQSDLNCGEFEEKLITTNLLNEFDETRNEADLISKEKKQVDLEKADEHKNIEAGHKSQIVGSKEKGNNIEAKSVEEKNNKVDNKAHSIRKGHIEHAHAKCAGIHAKFKHFHVGDKNVGDIVHEKIAKHLKENNKLTSKDVNRILNSVLQKAKYHDPETGEIKKLTKEQIEELKGLVHEYAAEALNLHNLTAEEHKTEKEDVIIHDKTHSELAQTKTDNKRHPQLPIITFVSYQAGVSGRELSRLTSILDKIADITRKMNEKKQKQKDAAADERRAENLKEDIKKEELKREDLKHNIQNEEIIKEQQTRGGTAFHPEVDVGDSFSRNTHKIWP